MKRFGKFFAIVAVVGLAATACGSSNEDSGSKTPSSNASAGGGSEAVSKAAAIATAAEARPTEILVDTPSTAKVPAGKVVYWIQCSIPACAQLGVALQDGADALGWQLKIIDGGITPETIKAAWEIAARDKPDAVVASGFPHSIYQQELDTLLGAKVPVVNIDITDAPLPGEHIVQGEADYVANGALAANWVLAEGGDKANVLAVTSSAFPVVGARAQGFQDELAEICPGCKVKVMEASPADIGGVLPTNIVGTLQANPDIEYIQLGVGDMATGLTSALESAGLGDKINIILADMNPALHQDIERGSALKASIMMEAVDMMWQSLDILLRVFTDQSVTADEKPAQMWIVTQKTVSSFDEPFPIVADYQAQYKKLWGLG